MDAIYVTRSRKVQCVYYVFFIVLVYFPCINKQIQHKIGFICFKKITDSFVFMNRQAFHRNCLSHGQEHLSKNENICYRFGNRRPETVFFFFFESALRSGRQVTLSRSVTEVITVKYHVIWSVRILKTTKKNDENQNQTWVIAFILFIPILYCRRR